MYVDLIQRKMFYSFIDNPGLESFFKDKSSQKVIVKIIYSEKATKICEIFTLLLTGTTQDKSKVKISQNFVAFPEYMNFRDFFLL